MAGVRGEILLLAIAVGAQIVVASPRAPAPTSSGGSQIGNTFVDALFRVGQTWKFRTELIAETEGRPKRTATPQVRCRVADVHRAGTSVRSRVRCEPLDEHDFTQTPSRWLQATYIARPDGLWR